MIINTQLTTYTALALSKGVIPVEGKRRSNLNLYSQRRDALSLSLQIKQRRKCSEFKRQFATTSPKRNAKS
ncbi:hypothetical protein CW304_05435 [Bacillus sp. UFRGS-B20]|nr:hypothetical protein CW304_05435 [Bacillus sp. UFRGS-B20]